VFDWQLIAVALIVLAALVYTARRALARLRSFAAGGGAAASSSCATACGKCGDEDAQAARPTNVYVQISPDRSPSPDRRS
jgi:cytochrome c553